MAEKSIPEEWAERAEEYYREAAASRRSGRKSYSVQAFLYQQSIEMYLKAYLLLTETVKEKDCRALGHRMGTIITLCSNLNPEFARFLPDADFTGSFVISRYANGADIYSEDVEQVAKTGKDVRALVRRYFKAK